jgi:hypothetical protein
MFTNRSLLVAGSVALLTVGLLPLGCADPTPPTTTGGDGTGFFLGDIDPQSGKILFKSIQSPGPDGLPIHVVLLGDNLKVDPSTNRVSLDVSVRNEERRHLYAPAEIIVSDLNPMTILLVNADWTLCDDMTMGPFPSHCSFGLDYSGLLGGDGVLGPGEESGSRTWVFIVPDLVGFSFGAAARFSLEPDQARIAGTFFWDHNADGVMNPDESGAGGGTLMVTGPDLGSRTLFVGEDGKYSFGVKQPGLYTLLAAPPPTFAPVRFTTPNPLEVVLPVVDGKVQSFLHADFGITNAWSPPVIIYDGTPDSLVLDPYALLDIGLDGIELDLRVGYGGCQPNHPLALYMVGGFMETASLPVQVRVILSHNDLDEPCDAWFTRPLRYDLRPIQLAYMEAYGRLDTIIVGFRDYEGQVHYFELPPVFTR